MLSKFIQKRQKGFHFILEETTNQGIINSGFVGERFVTESLPELGDRLKFMGRKGKEFTISIVDIEDAYWAGCLNLVQKADRRIGAGTILKSKNSKYLIRLIEVVQ